MNLNLFDAYNLRARFCVSIFYVAPFIFDIICFTHKTFSVTESIILSVIFVVICQALLGIHRTPVNKQYRKNTAAELLAPSSSLPAGMRARYYRKLASFEPEFQPLLNYINPEPQVNKAPSTDIGKLCIDVISWLRAKTRNPEMFRLVYEENINYGYARNMLRLKPIGIGANWLFVAFFCIYLGSISSTFTWDEHGLYCLCLIIHLITILYLRWSIDVSFVDAAATRYAHALLEAIDIL